MPHDHHRRTITGRVTHVFAHRFVVKTKDDDVLADLTPKGRDRIALHIGDTLTLDGEMKPSELKVSRLTRGAETIEIKHGDDKHHDDKHRHAPADPAIVIKAAREAGFEVLGEPRRKPKHFEVLGRKHDELTELHIELDGHIRKSKPIDSDDPKWSIDRAAS